MRVRGGHTLIKEYMRKYNALFCGEHSGHYFFRENFFADSAIIAVLLVLEMMSVKNKKLSELVDEYEFAVIDSHFEFASKYIIIELATHVPSRLAIPISNPYNGASECCELSTIFFAIEGEFEIFSTWSFALCYAESAALSYSISSIKSEYGPPF